MKSKFFLIFILLFLLCACTEKTEPESEQCAHVWSESYAQEDPTEKEEGARIYNCVLCGEKKEKAIPRLTVEDDVYVLISTPATCEDDGSNLYISDEWGEYEVILPAIGHDYSETPDECTATCEEDGENIYYCKNCHEKKTEEIRAFGHRYQLLEAHEGTCAEKGYTEYCCERCGDVLIANVTDYVHQFEKSTEVTGSCTQKGYIVYVCALCRTSKTVETDYHHIYNKDTGKCDLCQTECEHSFNDYVCSLCHFDIREELNDRSGIYAYGGITYFGSYPQSHVSDAALIEALDEVFADGKTDHVYCGATYACADVENQSGRSFLTFSDGTSMSVAVSGRSKHYFRYDPIAWKEGKNGTLIAVDILDGGAFQQESALHVKGNVYYVDEDEGIYANEWAHSAIRSFLAESFFNKAFNEKQKAMLQTVTNVNSGGYFAAKEERPWCAQQATEDVVFLPSYSDLYDQDDVTDERDEAKQKKVSDYALCSGLKMDEYVENKTKWFLRSSGLYSGQVCAVCYDGSLSTSTQIVIKSGIVPAIGAVLPE